MAIADEAYNEWVFVANEGYQQHRTQSKIEQMVRVHQIYAEKKEDRYALAEVPQRALTMVERMCRGEVRVIKPRNPNREQKRLVYKTVGVSENCPPSARLQ